jgi:hypothetical protein
MLGLEIRPFLEMGWYFDMKITGMHGELDSICESENIQQSNEVCMQRLSPLAFFCMWTGSRRMHLQSHVLWTHAVLPKITKECLKELSLVLTKIINDSLSSEVFLHE